MGFIADQHRLFRKDWLVFSWIVGGTFCRLPVLVGNPFNLWIGLYVLWVLLLDGYNIQLCEHTLLVDGHRNGSCLSVGLFFDSL